MQHDAAFRLLAHSGSIRNARMPLAQHITTILQDENKAGRPWIGPSYPTVIDFTFTNSAYYLSLRLNLL